MVILVWPLVPKSLISGFDFKWKNPGGKQVGICYQSLEMGFSFLFSLHVSIYFPSIFYLQLFLSPHLFSVLTSFPTSPWNIYFVLSQFCFAQRRFGFSAYFKILERRFFLTKANKAYYFSGKPREKKTQGLSFTSSRKPVQVSTVHGFYTEALSAKNILNRSTNKK